ncbi:histidine phosphatase family protein [Streptomyces sp. SID5785]|uniref:histidine phosphatase family protein n=1 Tax=Streptomyces sp. SID5785 TaxID=2690309 RepID=UPI0013616454|nr:histidine phosphatase family protein [Streptomyces sp. SID5785]MZD04865.1 histidine phosphatase family protein [Streptomyces sp. SID5785]
MSVSLRGARFDDGAPLDDAGRAAARAAAGALPADARAVTGGSPRCRETAGALGLDAAPAPQALAAQDMGRWRGRSLAEVSEAEPLEVARWLAEPDFAPGGGEPVAAVCARVAGWLDAPEADPARVVAVVEPEVVRAAVVHALGAPASAFWRCDVAPLTVTELSGRAGRWNVRLGRPLGSSGGTGG